MNLKNHVKYVLAWNGLNGRRPDTLTSLAEMLEVDRGNLSRFVAGKKGGAGITIETLADALGVSVTQLVTGRL